MMAMRWASSKRISSGISSACAVADALGLSPGCQIYDVSNACLGVLNGMIEVANRIELGQIRAGLVVSCETAREINELTLERLLQGADMDQFSRAIAVAAGSISTQRTCSAPSLRRC